MKENCQEISPLFTEKKFPATVLVGLGPFAKRHYFDFFHKFHFFPKLIIELDVKESESLEFFKLHDISIPIFTVPRDQRDCHMLPPELQQKLLSTLRHYQVTHAILCTEPKAHFAYLDFFIRNEIHILVEKPLTVHLNSSFSIEAAKGIEQDYLTLLSQIKKRTRVEVHCQRRYHPVYEFVLKQIEQFVTEFDIPLTYCDIYHCDGMWNMPDEFLFRENHPYKYGYGKLFHSGYHFIDLLSQFIKTCFGICSKEPDEIELYAVPFSPFDSLTVFNQDNYARFFHQKKYAEIYESQESHGFEKFGELDFHAILQLFSKKKRLMTSSVNLLQTGFCRRTSDHLPADTYKGNGRIRHERVNLQFGPLLNIQVHSYLSEEKKESRSTKLGSSRHFDVAIFKNSDLIGGKPFELFTSSDFTQNFDQSFNEISRERCLINFLLDLPSKSLLKDHHLSIKLLSNALISLCRKNNSENGISRFQLSEGDLCTS